MEPTKAEMEFPAQSDATTDALFTWPEVKTLLDKEHTRRAEYVTRILMALRERFGEEVMDIARKTIYQMGYEKGRARAAHVTQQGDGRDLVSLANLVAHRISRLYYGTTARVSGEELTMRETYCPLPRKWQEMGLPDDQVIELCLLFDQVDRGMVEGYNSDFVTELSGCEKLSEVGFCQMTVRKKGNAPGRTF